MCGDCDHKFPTVSNCVNIVSSFLTKRVERRKNVTVYGEKKGERKERKSVRREREREREKREEESREK